MKTLTGLNITTMEIRELIQTLTEVADTYADVPVLVQFNNEAGDESILIDIQSVYYDSEVQAAVLSDNSAPLGIEFATPERMN